MNSLSAFALLALFHAHICCTQTLQPGERCPDGSPAIVCITTPCNQCPNAPPGDAACPFEPFQCLVFPCEPSLAVCKAFPNATCRADCGCGKDFVDAEGFIVDCDGKDVCTLPQAPGSCPGKLKKVYFDSVTGKCEPFTYSGCNGNANRFDSVQACEKKCRKSPGNICTLPAVVGPCEALIPSWFFNSRTKKCERFTYGGCQGNANRFETEAECKKQCGGGPSDNSASCFLPKDVGPCDGAFHRYFYNAVTRSCEIFSFGGCQGNTNNFKTLQECESVCKKSLACSPKGGICGERGAHCCNDQECCKKNGVLSSFSFGTCGKC